MSIRKLYPFLCELGELWFCEGRAMELTPIDCFGLSCFTYSPTLAIDWFNGSLTLTAHCTTKLTTHNRGGEEVLLDVGGQDATEAFEDVGHSDEAREILDGLLVGTLKRGVCLPLPSRISDQLHLSITLLLHHVNIKPLFDMLT
jgi:hypothetical protein